CLKFIYMFFLFFFSSRRRHTRSKRDWSSDVCSSDLNRKSEKVGREKGGIWIDYQRIVAEIHHGRHLHRGWGNCLPQFRQQDGGCGAVCQRTVYHLHLGV